MYTVEDTPGQFRDCIKMVVLAKTIIGYPEPRVFRGDFAHTEYGAIENAAEDTLLFLANHWSVAIKDLNHEAMIRAIKNKTMAESYRELYKDALEASNQCGNKIRERYDYVVICAQYSQFLVLLY